MNLWLDDIRYPPEGWTWVTTVEECIAKLATGEVEMLSLDNDLGWIQDDDYLYSGERKLAAEGWKVVEWMVENNMWPHYVAVHSSNIIARQRMTDLIEKFGDYDSRASITYTVRGQKKDNVYPATAYRKED